MNAGFNVKCSAPSCLNPVIGQCTGYKRGCGRFYCAAHSHNGLCMDCAALLSEDQLIEDYVKSCQNVEKKVQRVILKTGLGFILAMLGLYFASQLMFTTFGVSNPIGIALYYAIYLTGAICIVYLLPKRRKLEKQMVREVEAKKPRFAEFYKAYKRDKNIQVLKGGAIFLIGAATAMVASDLQKSSEEARIRSAVDKEIDRRGL